MPRQNKIRWKSGEKEFLKREIRNFNRRRLRAVKKNPDLINFLPTVSYREVIKDITTRADYNRILRELNWSRAKNAFRIAKVGEAKTTKWQLRVSKSRLRKINRDRERERKTANVSTEKGTMGTIYQNNIQAKPFTIPSSQKEWEKFTQSIEKQVRDAYSDEKSELYAQNYMIAWNNNFGSYRETELKNLLSRLTAKQIADAMYWNPVLNLQFLYPESEDEEYVRTIADTVIRTWHEYINQL